MARSPEYREHKASGRAYIYINGKAIYLGKYGSPESHEAYAKLKAEWLQNRKAETFTKPEPAAKQKQKKALLLADICLTYLDHAEKYYSVSEFTNMRIAMQPISKLYATLPASQFGLPEFRAVRDWWLKNPIDTSKWGKRKSANPKAKTKTKPKPKPKATTEKPVKYRSRQYVNKCMKRLLRIIKWACSEGLIPGSIYDTLKLVPALKRGRCDAPEAAPIKPVADAAVKATLLHLTKVLADMVKFQQLTGCRPGEVCKLKPSMVDRSGEVWAVELAEHKTAHHGKSRIIYVGPKAQAVLLPYLLRNADDYCFSPIESEKQRREAQHAKRVTPLNQGNKPGTNKLSRKPRQEPGMGYTTGSYAKAIKYACKRAELDHWHPNQLRHSAATMIRKQFGIEAAQVILGHSEADTTQIYAERDAAKAAEIARMVG